MFDPSVDYGFEGRRRACPGRRANFKLTTLAACLILWSGSPPAIAQDGTDFVEGLNVARGEAPLPQVGRGAANYSPEQTASFLCEADDDALSFLTSMPAQRAHRATLKAREVRMRAFQGAASAKEMEEAELERQDAVRGIGGRQTAADFPGPEAKGLVIEDVVRKRVLENGRAVLLITGKIRNTNTEETELPPMSVQALDVRGFMLAGQTSQLEEVSIAPGAVQAFTFRFKNPPQYTSEIKAHFAPPFGLRNFRGCDFFDPLTFDPNQERVRAERAAAIPVPVPRVGEGAPPYTPKELAAMVRRARSDAQTSFNVRGQGLACAPMQGWRPLMVMADEMEEAWIATTAAEEVRRDAARGVFLPAEVAEAELARQTAVRGFMKMRPSPRQPGPVNRPGIAVRDIQRDGSDTLVIRAEVGNSGKERVEMPPLLVTVVDKYGFILTETLQRPGGRIRAGGAGQFSVTIAVPPSLVGEVRVVIAC